MRLALLILLLLAAHAGADVVLVNVVRCNGGAGAHDLGVRFGDVLRETRNGSMSSGGAVVTSTGFVAADVGRTLIVHGAGPSGVDIVSVSVSQCWGL